MSRAGEMDAKRQCYWWWFDSHKNARSSPWLQSTLSDLNEKTKAMLKVIDEDADSFAQRAEMYYKKRPELISMVEDFYRAHRSLAERYDQMRFHQSPHARSALRYSFHPPKSEYDNVPISIKCFDSFSEVGYNSEDSEIDNPGDFDIHVDLDGHGTENLFPVGSIHDELMKLKDDLAQIREENELARNIIEQKEKENEELMKRVSSDLMKFTEEIERLKAENMNMKEELKQKEVEKMAAKRQVQEVMRESRKLREEVQSENRVLKEMVVEKDEGKREMIRQLSSAMDMLRDENLLLRKLIIKKQSSPDFQIFKGMNWRQLFNFSSKHQTSSSVVPLQM